MDESCNLDTFRWSCSKLTFLVRKVKMSRLFNDEHGGIGLGDIGLDGRGLGGVGWGTGLQDFVVVFGASIDTIRVIEHDGIGERFARNFLVAWCPSMDSFDWN